MYHSHAKHVYWHTKEVDMYLWVDCISVTIALFQEIEPSCAADLCSLWPNCENPDDHLPVITSRRRKNSDNAARYPSTTPHVTSHQNHATSQVCVTRQSCLSGLASIIPRWFFTYMPLLITRTYFVLLQGLSNVQSTNDFHHCNHKHLPINRNTLENINYYQLRVGLPWLQPNLESRLYSRPSLWT